MRGFLIFPGFARAVPFCQCLVPVPTGQVLRCLLRYRRQVHSVWPQEWRPEAVDHVEEQGRWRLWERHWQSVWMCQIPGPARPGEGGIRAYAGGKEMFLLSKSFNFVETLKKICNNVRRKIKWMFLVFCSLSAPTCVSTISPRDYVV